MFKPNLANITFKNIVEVIILNFTVISFKINIFLLNSCLIALKIVTYFQRLKSQSV